MVKHRKFIKQIGNSLGIILNREEQKINQIKKDDLVDVEIKKCNI